MVKRLEDFLGERWSSLGDRDPRARKFDAPEPRPPFEQDEASGFMRGIDAGLFTVEPVMTKAGVVEMGYRSHLCDVNQHFFADGAKTGKRTFSREAVAQWAAACDLVTLFGWDEARVLIESDDAFALDFLGFDRDRRETGRVALLAGEAKANERFLDRMITETIACAEAGPSAHRGWPDTTGATTAHRKCVSLNRLAGQVERLYFWAVAPGIRRGFWARVCDDRLRLEGPGAGPGRPSA